MPRPLWLPLLLLLTACGDPAPRLTAGDPAPDFALEDLAGNRVRLADLRGQVVALRFWADWCPYCRDEMRELEPVHQRLRGRGLRLLAVNVGQQRDTAERFVTALGISYDTLLDRDSAVARRYGVIGLPTTFLIDRAGVVRGKVLGEAEAAAFEGMVVPLLETP